MTSKRGYESTSICTRLALMVTGSRLSSSSGGRLAALILGVLNLDAICIEASGMAPGLGALGAIPPYRSRVEEESEGGVDVEKDTPVGVGGILDAAV